MAIALCYITDSGNESTSLLSGEDSDQLDPCFAVFKRILFVYAFEPESNRMFENLKLIDKYSIQVDWLEISTKFLFKMMKSYKDKEVNLKLQSLKISSGQELYIEDKVIEFINKIDPKILAFRNLKLDSINIEAFAMLNCPNINANNSFMSNSYLLFLDTPIQLFKPYTNWKLSFQWESIELFIEVDKMAKIILFKTDAGTFLFIPTKIVKEIIICGKRKIPCERDIAEQLADLHIKPRFKSDGLIVPIEYSKRIFIRLDDCELHCLNQIKYIYQVFKEKHIELEIKKFDKLLKINKLLPDDFPNISFRFCNDDIDSIEETEKIEKLSMPKMMDNPDLFNLKLIKISKLSILSPNEYSFWWKMLRSTRTRLNLYLIRLKFSLLSECLAVLSLCSNCPKIEYINLQYWEADKEDELETVEHAEREFRQKFEMIKELNISKINRK